MTSRELIRRVLERDRPPRVGLTYSAYEGRARVNDVAGLGPAADPSSPATGWQADGAGGETMVCEWGCLWRRLIGKTVGGEVIEPALKSWADLESYRLPTLDDPARYAHGERVREQQADRYLLGTLHGCAFNYARYLRGMGQYLLDCAAEPESIRRLNRLLCDLAMRQADVYAELGADGVFFCEDWGTEDRLLVSPAMWQHLFRPDFERLIDHVHRRGLTFWIHSCGYIKDIVPPLAELGADVLQLDQPELSGLEFLAEQPVTYWCPVDIQQVVPTGDQAAIEARARAMLRTLGGRGGGLIAKDYPDNASIGCQPLWQHWGYEVFRQEGVYA